MSIYRAKPQAAVDNFLAGGPGRAGRYGEAYTLPLNPTSKHFLADEGSYFVATNPTPGTGIAFAVNASMDFTKSLFLFKNTAAAGGPRMYLDYIKLLPTVAPASATSFQFAVQVDTAGVNRYTSGGTLVSGVNVNGDDATASVGSVYYATSAVITTAAAGPSVRLVSRGVGRSVIPAVLDEIVISFGGDASIASSSGTAVGRTGTSAPPVIVGPQEFGVFNAWFPSNALTALSYEFECGWFER